MGMLTDLVDWIGFGNDTVALAKYKADQNKKKVDREETQKFLDNLVERYNKAFPNREHYVSNVLHYRDYNKKLIRKGVILDQSARRMEHKGLYGWYSRSVKIAEVNKNGSLSNKKPYWTEIFSSSETRKGDWYESNEWMVCFNIETKGKWFFSEDTCKVSVYEELHQDFTEEFHSWKA